MVVFADLNVDHSLGRWCCGSGIILVVVAIIFLLVTVIETTIVVEMTLFLVMLGSNLVSSIFDFVELASLAVEGIEGLDASLLHL